MKRLVFTYILSVSSALYASGTPKAGVSYVKLTNKINENSLSQYGKKPDFKIIVNNETLKPGETVEVPVENNSFMVRYEYSFLKGLYKGGNDVQVTLEKKPKKEYELLFSWNNKDRVIVPY